MDIYQFAMQMEKDGEAYYRQQAEKTNNEGLRYILNMLADEEVKHFQILEKLHNKVENPQLVTTNVLQNSKNVFEKMAESNQKFDFDAAQVAYYRKAREIEEKSYRFYLEKSELTENAPQKQLLLKLAEEEKKHMFLMENLEEFVARPDSWIENAEFNHFDAY